MPDGPQWAHEAKHDGYRMLCRRDGDRVRIFSRNALDWTDRVTFIVEALRLLPIASATIDGDAVIYDSCGVTRRALRVPLLAALGEGQESGQPGRETDRRD